MQDHYDTLGLKRDASKEDIKKAYRDLVLKVHPDKGGTNETFDLIHTAYEVLIDPVKRKIYDRTIKRALKTCDEKPSPRPLKKYSGNAELHLELMTAIYANNIKRVQSLLKINNINANKRDHNHITPLICAALGECYEIIKLLLAYPGIDINARDMKGLTALDYATQRDYYDIVKLLLNQDDVKIEICGIYNILRLAIEHNDVEFVQSLMKKKDINLNRQLGFQLHPMTALIYAAQCGHYKMVEFLIACGVDSNSQDMFNRTALHYAAKHSHYKIVKLLLNQDDVKIETRDIYNILRIAIEHNDIDCVRRLIKYKDIVVKLTVTDLVIAVRNSYSNIVELLLDYQCVDINDRDIFGCTALDWAIDDHNYHLIKLLLQHGSLLTEPTDAAEIFIASVDHNDSEGIQLLLQQTKFNINQRLPDGTTPLIYAVKNGCFEIVKLLVKHNGINVNLRDEKGGSALEWAINNGFKQVVYLLVNLKDIDVNRPSRYDGLTPLQIAGLYCDLKIARILVENGAKILVNRNLKPWHEIFQRAEAEGSDARQIENFKEIIGYDDLKDRETAKAQLFEAPRTNKNADIIDALIGNANKSSVQNGMTPLLTAIKYGNIEAVKCLVNKNAEINPKDAKRWRDVIKEAEKDNVDPDRLKEISRMLNVRENEKLLNLINNIDGPSDEVTRYLVTNGPEFFNDKKEFLQDLYQNNNAVTGKLLCDLLSCYFNRHKDKREYFTQCTKYFCFFPMKILAYSRLEKLEAIENAIRFVIGEAKNIDADNIPVLKNGRTKKLVWDRIETRYLLSQGMSATEDEDQSQSFKI